MAYKRLATCLTSLSDDEEDFSLTLPMEIQKSLCVNCRKKKYFWEENAWYHEVQDLGRLFTEKDYDACYKALETTLAVVAVLEEARKAGNLGF